MLRDAFVSACVSMLLLAPAPVLAQDPAALNPCVVVIAGSGSKAGTEAVTQFWHTVNTAIAKSLVQRLTADRVAARLEVIPVAAPPEKVPGLVALALDRERCKQLLQFTHQLGGGSGPEAFFAFEAVVLGVETAAGGFKLGAEAFKKTYRYPMTNETLKNLSVSEVASS